MKRYICETTGQIWDFPDGVDIKTLKDIPKDLTLLEGDRLQAVLNPPKTLTEQDFTIAVQSYLDETAQKTKWDNMQSARAAAGIPLDGTESDVEIAMHADAVKLSRWYLKVWAYGYAVLDAIKAGTRAVPTSTEAFIEELPKLGA